MSSELNASDIESPRNDENDTLKHIEGDKDGSNGSDGHKSPQFYRSESSQISIKRAIVDERAVDTMFNFVSTDKINSSDENLRFKTFSGGSIKHLSGMSKATANFATKEDHDHDPSFLAFDKTDIQTGSLVMTSQHDTSMHVPSNSKDNSMLLPSSSGEKKIGDLYKENLRGSLLDSRDYS